MKKKNPQVSEQNYYNRLSRYWIRSRRKFSHWETYRSEDSIASLLTMASKFLQARPNYTIIAPDTVAPTVLRLAAFCILENLIEKGFYVFAGKRSLSV